MKHALVKRMWTNEIALEVKLSALAMLLTFGLTVAPAMASDTDTGQIILAADLPVVLSPKVDGEPSVNKISGEQILPISSSTDHSGSNYLNACASCHYAGKGKLQLGDRSALGDSDPEEFIETTLFGKPAEFGENGLEMPGFAKSFSDAEIARLAAGMRASMTSKSPWPNLEPTVARMRAKGAEK